MWGSVGGGVKKGVRVWGRLKEMWGEAWGSVRGGVEKCVGV